MRPTRKTTKRPPVIESSDSEDEIPTKKRSPQVKPIKARNPIKNSSDSSSESDIEDYLQHVDKIDLGSSFFSVQNKTEPTFQKIEKDIFAGVTRLSDSDSDSDEVKDADDKKTLGEKNSKNIETFDIEAEAATSSKLTFQELNNYTKKIEEAKKLVEQYNAKKQAQETNSDILNLLITGETKNALSSSITPADLHSSDFESCDSDNEDWEEIKIKEDKEKPLVSNDGLQITVSMPEAVRKKKGVDLLAAMKRRLNRIRKENQVFVHKVHLLCWIAHGNFVNSSINNSQTLAMALSLLPSEHCYPSERTDLSYLEQIVNWYKRTVKLFDKPLQKDLPLDKALQVQINKKEARNKKMLVYIFVAILRSLGIHCRLVLSFQVEPLRPPASDLHSISTKEGNISSEKVRRDKNTVSTSKDKKKVHSKKDPKEETKNNKKGKIDKNTASSSKENKKVDLNFKKEETKSSSRTSECREGKKYDVINEQLNSKAQTFLKKQKTQVEEKEKVSNSSNKRHERPRRTKETNLKTENKEKTNLAKDKGKKNCDEKTEENSDETTKKSLIKTSQESSKTTLTVPKTDKRSKSAEKTKSTTLEGRTTRSKSASTSKEKKDLIKIKLPTTNKKKKENLPQVDGFNDSSSEGETDDIPQLDKADSKKNAKSNKPNLRKLKDVKDNPCTVKNHSKRLKESTGDSSDEFSSPSPTNKSKTQSQNRKVNLQKLNEIKKVHSKSSPTKTKETSKHFSPSPQKQLDVRNDIMSLIKDRIVEQKHIDRSRKVKKRKLVPDSDTDSDYAPEPIKKKHHESDDEFFIPKTKVKRRIPAGKNVLSTINENDGSVKRKIGNDVWVEVFLENEEKWISVDLVHGQVHCVKEIYQRATHPLSYIVAWNNDNTLKDVTKRYCQNFNTVTRKLRVDAKWWKETITPFCGKPTARDNEEDDDLERQQLDQPLPKSVAEYKNHPLYVLRRHLLKFEALYPPEPPILGFIRNEPVHPRSCVYVCHSREIWVKSAKVVKPGEKPYKIVKARPKYDKLSNKVITDQMLEIFGPWQTEDYVPPTAENGVVPRNAYGNVELFKSCMLPKGTVHLKLPGLNKVARRMNIDCASAIVGFDFHGGYSHPTYDGFVVCEEFEDVLVAAWDMEQAEIEKKEEEKIEKRVYGNWKKLIKGLLIRERLKARYDFGGPSEESDKKTKNVKGPSFPTKKR